MSELKTISPARAAQLMRKGAVLIDIREADEHARERIPGARHHALSRIDAEGPARPRRRRAGISLPLRRSYQGQCRSAFCRL